MFKSKRQKRGAKVLGIGLFLSLLVYLVLSILKENVEWYMTPSELTTYHALQGERLHLGGVVKRGSLKRIGPMSVDFVITDFKKEIHAHYQGILPGLFREGKGAVLTGHLEKNHRFLAIQILAKHDENYSPIGKHHDH